MKKERIQQLSQAFGTGLAFGLGVIASALLAVTVSGTIHSFSSGETISSSKVNENFSALRTAINNLPLGTYCGLTAASYNGNSFGGYTGAKTLCETACNDSRAHMCTSHELALSAQLGMDLGAPSQWYSSFQYAIISGSFAVTDCEGWTSSATTVFGSVVGSTDQVAGQHCGLTAQIACCL